MIFFDFFPGQLEVAEILIEANAQVNIKDDNGLTAFCIAKSKGEFIEFIMRTKMEVPLLKITKMNLNCCHY